MTIFQAVVLGLVQGFSEFLPVSSSAHLSLVPWFFGWRDPGLSFDVALHVGTLVAVLWYFRREWVQLARAGLQLLIDRRADTPEARRVIFLVIATIPAAIGGLALEKYAEEAFRAPALTATALIVMGVVLWAADRYAAQSRELGAMTWRDALLIGVAQVFALIPGVSRSGATMSAGRGLQFDRQSAAVFSFLMSMPVIAAAAILKVPHLFRDGGDPAPLLVGILAATISSWLAIAILLRYLTRHSFGVFAVYRLALGMVVFIVLAHRA
jgi:undecaprenyl-diphosphatase